MIGMHCPNVERIGFTRRTSEKLCKALHPNYEIISQIPNTKRPGLVQDAIKSLVSVQIRTHWTQMIPADDGLNLVRLTFPQTDARNDFHMLKPPWGFTTKTPTRG